MPQQVWGTDLILSRRLLVLAPWSPRLGLLRLPSDAQRLAPPPRAVPAMTTVHGAEAAWGLLATLPEVSLENTPWTTFLFPDPPG